MIHTNWSYPKPLPCFAWLVFFACLHLQASLLALKQKSPQLSLKAFVPHIGKLSNQFIEDLNLIFSLKPLLSPLLGTGNI
jgi:hypothetical protein